MLKKYAIAFLIVCSILSNAVSISAFADAPAVGGEPVLTDISEKSEDYQAYIEGYKNVSQSTESIEIKINSVLSSEKKEFAVDVAKEGLYTFGMSYKAANSGIDSFKVALMIDGEYPYDLSEKLVFPRMWQDEHKIRTDDNGNQFSPTQIQAEDYCYNVTTDTDSEFNLPLRFYLGAGRHNISVSVTNGEMDVEYAKFDHTKQVKKYSKPAESELYKGKAVTIEAEKATLKSNYFLVARNDNSTTKVTPHSATNAVLNYIGGGNWSSMGDTIYWKTPYLKAGYYCMGFSYKQNSQIGSKTYRTLKIDGEMPFSEAENIGFSYDDNWQNETYSDPKGNPYYVYFSEGEHIISLSVTAGKMASIRSELSEAITMINRLYLDINMITGENVDVYRDYDLFSQIKDMETRLKEIRKLLKKTADDLLMVIGTTSGSNYSVIMNLLEVVDQMLKNKYEAHKYKSYFYSNYCSVSSVLQDMREMPLSLDKIVLFSKNDEDPFKETSFFDSLYFSAERFIYSFVEDYDQIDNGDDRLTVWVNWGRDQAQVLDSLVKRSFTAKTGINVDIKLTNASVVQAVVSGTGPDCILQRTRSEPVNLAMRGVLYDLSSFDDCDEVLKRFQNGAEIPYMYKNSLYALPDTQTFFMMFYRTDVFEELELSVPKTWNELKVVAKLLSRNNMSVWFPNNTIIDNTQINHGIGSVNIFPSLLMQNGIDIYSSDGKSTNLTSAETSDIFSEWTGYYNRMKFPKTLDFYNRFRTGTTPLGIAPYTLYTTLTVAAPEISGQWAMTLIPGTEKADGTVDHTSSGGGTGCCIMKDSEHPEKAWEFLKWWTEEDTQLTFSIDVESILGPSGRVALSNVNAIKSLSWTDGTLDELLNAWANVKEIPEYPGSYYVSRSVYQAFWSVVQKNKNPKEMLAKYGKEADDEIARKWEQYYNR